MKKIPKEIVHDMAATAFWSYAFEQSYADAISAVDHASIDPAMWSPKKADKALKGYGAHPDKSMIKGCFKQVEDEIAVHVAQEKNLLGRFYIEDLAGCKTADFSHHNLLSHLRDDGDDRAGYNVSFTPENVLPKGGHLLIRTPLPAVVVATDVPSSSLPVLIENTDVAMGFRKTVLLIIQNLSELPQNEFGFKYILNGVFQIPTKEPFNDTWLKLIPNATCVTQGFTYYGEKTSVSMDIERAMRVE